jgi:hypothetical protein
MILQALSGIGSMPAASRPRAFMGFDGFVDTVGRLSHGDGAAFGSMAAFGAFLMGRQEKNCSLEVRRSVRKMGGNAPICANALAQMGIPSACVGAMGIGAPEPAFAEMNPLCALWPVAMPGECLALEFADSKLFLADMSGPQGLTWETLTRAVGLEKLAEMANGADLLGLFNWGELPNIQQVWEGFAREVLPKLDGRRRTAVFDLSDCSGRNAAAISSALAVIRSFRRHMRVVLSANDNEILSIAAALGYRGEDTASAAATVYRSDAMDMLAHHALTYARVIDGGGAATVNGIHIDNPVLVTGGGDHFNAGLCLGLLAGLDASGCATLGNTVSRLYVSTGQSPELPEVLRELSTYHIRICKEEGA